MMVEGRDVKSVAVKELKKEMYRKYAAEFEEEVKTMTKLSHPNIVKLLGQSTDTENSTDGGQSPIYCSYVTLAYFQGHIHVTLT